MKTKLIALAAPLIVSTVISSLGEKTLDALEDAPINPRLVVVAAVLIGGFTFILDRVVTRQIEAHFAE